MSYLEDICKGRSDDFMEGLEEGIRLFTWWKDGEQYVGTTGKTLKEIIIELDKIRGIEE